ncbi:peptide chain release factor 1 [Rickettsiales bacterium (ex Bugula neritina AB1)]|nr:peptide chain release factor 1 [Rickettsiales bacterium (ex Bugula neritina AB1)]
MSKDTVFIIFNKYKKLQEELQNCNDYKKIGVIQKDLSDNESLYEKVNEYMEILSLMEITQKKNDYYYELEKCIKNISIDIENLIISKKAESFNKNIVMEVRACAGGDEATLFVADVVRMYKKYAEIMKFETEDLNFSTNEFGGLKESIFSIKGKDVLKYFQFEAGVHRVQRVPETEKNGRIQTSTIAISILPEEEMIDINVQDNDLKIDVFRARGPGGQSVNTTDSAVRVTHIPTGIIVQQQDEKSQHKNKEKAIKILKMRLLQIEQDKQNNERFQKKTSQMGTGERSEKIRTYNFLQDRITDHRYNITFHNLPKILNGDLRDFINRILLESQKI